MDSTSVMLDFLMKKFKSEKKWTLRVIEQLSDEDIIWAPTPESNSIANLVAHIWGTVHQRIETNLPPLTNSGVDNQATVLEVILHQFRHLPGHTAQIIYIAKMRKGYLRWD